MQILKDLALLILVLFINGSQVSCFVQHRVHQIGQLVLHTQRQIFVYVVGQHVQLVLLGQVLVAKLPGCCYEYLISSFIHSLVALLVAYSVKEFIQIIALLLSGLQLVLEMGLLLFKILVCGAQLSNCDAHILN